LLFIIIDIGEFELKPRYGKRWTRITISRTHNHIPEFSLADGPISIRFIENGERRVGHSFVLTPHDVNPDSIQLVFNPNVEVSWENSTQEGAIEYDVKIREYQLGTVSFTWMSRKTWALEGVIERFIASQDPQSQSEHGSQNVQSTTTTTGQHGGLMDPVYSQFFSGTDLKLLFEKANIKGSLSFFLSFFSFWLID